MENNYKNHIFLSKLLDKENYAKTKSWLKHQEIQFSFLSSKGLSDNSVLFDVGCGPMRLGVKAIPFLKSGWYFGLDVNSNTLEKGRKVLKDHKIESDKYTLIQTISFDCEKVHLPVDIAFSNSLFSHLTLNSIFICLKNVRKVLKSDGKYYSTFFASNSDSWNSEIERTKWGRKFYTYPNSDPYHYPISVLVNLAEEAGFSMTIDPDYEHPTQTMACFRAK